MCARGGSPPCGRRYLKQRTELNDIIRGIGNKGLKNTLSFGGIFAAHCAQALKELVNRLKVACQTLDMRHRILQGQQIAGQHHSVFDPHEHDKPVTSVTHIYPGMPLISISFGQSQQLCGPGTGQICGPPSRESFHTIGNIRSARCALAARANGPPTII